MNKTATGSTLSCYIDWITTELQKKEFGEVSIKFKLGLITNKEGVRLIKQIIESKH